MTKKPLSHVRILIYRTWAVMKPVITERKHKQTVSQIHRQTENTTKPPLRYKNMMKKYDTAG